MFYTIDKHGIASVTIDATTFIKEPIKLEFAVDTTEDRHDIDKAMRYLKGVIRGDYGPFMQPGCRNQQAVNISIALDVLGYCPIDWLVDHWKEMEASLIRRDTNDFELFTEHLNRIEPYLQDWHEYGPWNFTLD